MSLLIKAKNDRELGNKCYMVISDNAITSEVCIIFL